MTASLDGKIRAWDIFPKNESEEKSPKKIYELDTGAPVHHLVVLGRYEFPKQS